MRTDDLLLQDMRDAIKEILENTPENRDAYDENKLLRSHLVRNIQIIGEAASRISKEVRDAVYETAVNDVPQLQPLIEGIITEMQNKQY